MVSPETIPIRIGTHDGPFHGDDVLAVAILSRIYANHHIIRTRDLDFLELMDFVVDVGGVYDHTLRRYDHHMPDPPLDRSTGHMYSSAGLIWGHYWKAYFKAIGIPSEYTAEGLDIDLWDEVYHAMRIRWIRPIDLGDNGIYKGTTPVSSIVNAFSPIDAEKTAKRYDALFTQVTGIVSTMFERECFHAVDQVLSRAKFLHADKEYLFNDRVLISPVPIRNFGQFIDSPLHFIISPAEDPSTGDISYSIRPVPDRYNSRSYKTPFPVMLQGLDRSSLEASAFPECTFVHHTGFMARTDTREGAIAVVGRLLGDTPWSARP